LTRTNYFSFFVKKEKMKYINQWSTKPAQRVSGNDSKKDKITYTDSKSTLAINKQKLARHINKRLVHE